MSRTTERFVLVGLATARSTWLARVSQWVTSGSLPAELVRCLTVEEFRATLRGRRVSVALVDEMSRHADRDLLAAVRAAGGAAVVVTGRPPRRDWGALGADALLSEDFDVSALSELLRTRALPVDVGPESAADWPSAASEGQRGSLVAVCGPGGTGASTVACALAQGLTHHPGPAAAAGNAPPGSTAAGSTAAGSTAAGSAPQGVVLADMALNGELALLHGVPPGAGGLPALVEAHRRGAVDGDGLDEVLVALADRGYLLLTGIARRRAWLTLRPRALRSAVAGLRSRFAWVVADTDSDAEGEPDSGSLDVEERNAMSRCALGEAAAVVVVGQPGVKGVYSLLRTIEEAVAFGVSPERVVPVVNRCRSGRLGRSEMETAIEQLGADAATRPVFLPERDVERVLLDGGRLPAWLVDPVTAAVVEAVDKGGVPVSGDLPQRVEPGSLAHWDTPHEGALPV